MIKRNYQGVGETLPKEWGITEFWMDGNQVILTSKGVWTVIKSPEFMKKD